MSGYAGLVKSVVQQIPYNSLFYANLLWESELLIVPEKTYYKSLERLVAQKELVHLAKGIYYRPYKRDGEIVPISTEEIIAFYTEESSGIVIGDALYEKAGIIDASRKEKEVLSNRTSDVQKKVGDVTVRKVDMVLNEDTISVIEMLEILQNYQKLNNPRAGRLLAYMKNFACNYNEESVRYVLKNRKYKKSTIAFLRQILEWYAVKNSLNRYLSSLSVYKIPSIDELQQETPDNVKMVLNLYVEKLKDIYGQNIRRIILYGSYARGDFTEESDIDVMILLKLSDLEIKKYRHSLSEMTYELNMEHDIEINPIVKDIDEFQKWVEVYPFYASVQKEGVDLFGAA